MTAVRKKRWVKIILCCEAVIYNWIMANFIKTFLGFDFSKNNVNNVVSSTTKIKNAVISIGPVFQSLKKSVDKMSHVTYWVGISASAEKAFGGVKSIVGSVAGDLKKIYGFADDYAKKGDKIAKTSRLVGLSVKDYQAFSSAAEDSGMSIEEMDSALKKFNVNLAKARGGDKTMLANFSKALFGQNSNLKGLNGLKTNRDVLVALADSYSKVKSAEDKSFMSSELFGKSGLKMSEILSQGGKSVQLLLDSYDKGFTDNGAAKAEEFTHQLQMMHEEFDGIKISVAQELFPIFHEMFKEITGMLKGKDGSKLKSSLLDAGKSLTTFVKGILPRIPRILETVVKIVDMLTPEVVAGIGLFLSVLPALGQITLGVMGMIPLLTKIGGIMKVGILGVVGAVVAKIGLVIAGAWSVYSIFTQIHQNWRMFSDYIEEKLTTATGITYTLWAALRSIVGHFEMTYRLVGLIFGGWNEWSKFVREDLGNVNYIVDLIGDCLAGVMYGIYEAFNWVSEKLQLIGGYLGKLPIIGKLLGGRVKFDIASDIGSDYMNGRSTLAASAAQAISESHTTVTNRFAVDFNNVPRGTKITPPPKGDFDWSRGYVLGGI